MPRQMASRRRVGVFGWGVVAPRCPDIESFAARLESAESWLEPFDGFGPNNFLVGRPDFDFGRYEGWIDQRFPPSRYPQLVDKSDLPTQYAIAAFLQALQQNPGLEAELERLGTSAHVYVGTGLGAIDTTYRASLALDRAQRRWDRFWAAPERNAALRAHLEGSPEAAAPPVPDEADAEDREEAESIWAKYWAGRSSDLESYLAELREIESLTVEGEVESGKMRLLREKRRRLARLEKRWGAPQPPWLAVSANLLWNIHNIPAAQISMLGRIAGLSFAPVAACSTFAVALKLGMDAIRSGEADAVVVGATDPPPHPLVVAAFYRARVISADGAVSKPLTTLRGTHVAGGSVVWILGDYERMTARGFEPLGLEPLAVGTSSDADHIITPSREGPLAAVRQALGEAGVAASEVGTWDLHATATPGDATEVETMTEALTPGVLATARKGTFGHGMAAGGGWELTAQYLGFERGRLLPTPLAADELNPEIGEHHGLFVFDRSCALPPGVAGKLSMGIGGVNACVISRPWPRGEAGG